MMKLSLIVAILVVASGGTVFADQVIWSNTGAGSGWSIITQVDTDGAGNTSECADDFVLAAPTTVTSVAPSYYFGGTGVTVDQWNISIYGDNTGTPGTLLHSTTAPGASYAATGTNPDQILSLTLATPFAAAASTTYWISLQAAYTQTQGSGLARWREIKRDDPALLQGNVAYWRGNPIFGGLSAINTWEPVAWKNDPTKLVKGEMAYSLYGTSVPEPSSVLALGSGLAALVGLARKRRS